MQAITVRVDRGVKKQAEVMLEDMGINMTTYINSSLRALVREKRVPFRLVTNQYLADQEILEKLTEAEEQAGDPKTKWLSHDEVFGEIREKYGYEI
jgi:DNA-damage-inducible protein J